VWDVGGQDKIRPLWRHYFQNTQGKQAAWWWKFLYTRGLRSLQQSDYIPRRECSSEDIARLEIPSLT
jgi:hypothetical protein